MPHPHVRTWSLGALDQGVEYRLWLDPVAYRWEVARLDDPTGTPLVVAGSRTERQRRRTTTTASAVPSDTQP